MVQEIEVKLPGRDRLRLKAEVDESGNLLEAQLELKGCPELLAQGADLRARLKGPVDELEVPEGDGHVELLLRELVLRLQGKWQLPYSESELCHCRRVPTATVDAAIVGGATSVSAVRRKTSAGTGCGICQPDIEKMLQYRRPGSG